jgi:hypothetical protein
MISPCKGKAIIFRLLVTGGAFFFVGFLLCLGVCFFLDVCKLSEIKVQILSSVCCSSEVIAIYFKRENNRKKKLRKL